MSPNPVFTVKALALTALLMAFTACGGDGEDGVGGENPGPAPITSDCDAAVLAGASAFAENCSGCHGELQPGGVTSGQGMPGGPIDASDSAWGSANVSLPLHDFIRDYMGGFAPGCTGDCPSNIAAFLTYDTAAPFCPSPTAAAQLQGAPHRYAIDAGNLTGATVYGDVRFSADDFYYLGADVNLTDTWQPAAIEHTERAGLFGYELPLAPGYYEVTLFLRPSADVFTVEAEGEPVFAGAGSDYAAGNAMAIIVLPLIAVTDGMLNLDFLPLQGNAHLSALTVAPGSEVLSF